MHYCDQLPTELVVVVVARNYYYYIKLKNENTAYVVCYCYYYCDGSGGFVRATLLRVTTTTLSATLTHTLLTPVVVVATLTCVFTGKASQIISCLGVVRACDEVGRIAISS